MELWDSKLGAQGKVVIVCHNVHQGAKNNCKL